MSLEGRGWQRLGEDVRRHIMGRHIGDRNGLSLDLLTCIMIRQVNMLGGSAVDGIIVHCNSALRIGEQRDWMGELRVGNHIAQFFQEFRLSGGFRRRTILAVVGGGGDVGVQGGFPGDNAPTEVEYVRHC